MRRLLRQAYGQDLERSFLGECARRLGDPAMLRGANYRSRLHPLWMTLGLIGAFILGVFLYFSFTQS